MDRDHCNDCSRSIVQDLVISNEPDKPRDEEDASRLHCEDLEPTETPTHRVRAAKESHKPIGSLAWAHLNVSGFGSTTDYQKTFSNYPSVLIGAISGSRRRLKTTILQDLEGIVKGGQMLLILGKPGSGCTTLLKTLAGHTHGLSIDERSMLNYQGVPWETMRKQFRDKTTYQAESDIHFAQLTVGQTLAVAAEASTPKSEKALPGRRLHAWKKSDTALTTLGLSDSSGTKVGNDFVRGISGGEQKRLSIAEVLVRGSTLQCWDNSTRGLDSGNARRFLKAIRTSSLEGDAVALVTIYQASQEMYEIFDRVTLLYDGRQVYFGDVSTAKTYFSNLGFVCPDGLTTSDFLTSLTNPAERIVRGGFETKIPRTADEFASVWKDSMERVNLLAEIKQYQEENPINTIEYPRRGANHVFDGLLGGRRRSPFILSFSNQIKICIRRGFQRIFNDLAPPLSAITGNAIVSIILGSMFYDMPENTSTFYCRGVLLFFTVLTNTFLGAFEGVQLWEHRPIVEKHSQYALYHPAAEAVSSMLCDLPNKLLLTASFNIPFYFLANMRRTPAAFFIFYLFAFSSLLTRSMLFRTIGAFSQTLTTSIAPGADFILLLVIYTGFVVPIPSMRPWLRWFNYVDPVGYAFESLMINEFAGRRFSCSSFIPQGPDYLSVDAREKSCTAVGADAGSDTVSGSRYLFVSFNYQSDHLWRNFGFMIAFMVVLCSLYLLATETILAQQSKGEMLVFRRSSKSERVHDAEAQSLDNAANVYAINCRESARESAVSAHEKLHAATFLWDRLCYKVKTKDGPRSLLEDVDGWIKPGTLTALMGASGAGKTTLLNVLANRASTGVISGDRSIDNAYGLGACARKIGYAQQQDLHHASSTVRESLIFSACLRQPGYYSRAENLAHVDEVIEQLGMVEFADAIVGIPGAGLNVEQRKRLTIGIELAARPELLLFLDEPTSGLDSNTAWSICTLLRKLADNGQSILCTIHQPSKTLFQTFDRVLFLQSGRTSYFGDVGPNSENLTGYFERHGARTCKQAENPADWLIDITDESVLSSGSRVDWAEIWSESEEKQSTRAAIEDMKKNMRKPATSNGAASREYARSFAYQLYTVCKRNLVHDWRTPSYLYSKILLTLGAGLFNGFSFYMSAYSLQGVQNQIFSTFLVFTLHSNLVQLIMPRFLENRDLYESHERPSRTYSWPVFLLSNFIVEVPWQTVLAVIQYTTWYYPLGMYRVASDANELSGRGGLMFLIIWSFMTFSSTFSQMLATVMPDAPTGINVSTLLYSLSLIFCGVLLDPIALPRFWIFMYRSTPVTYFLSAIVSTGIAGTDVVCSEDEIVKFNTPMNTSCGTYLANFLSTSGARLLNPSALDQCRVCPISRTDDVLAILGIFYNERWRQFGISLIFSVINVAISFGLYWLFRVPKGPSRRNV